MPPLSVLRVKPLGASGAYDSIHVEPSAPRGYSTSNQLIGIAP